MNYLFSFERLIPREHASIEIAYSIQWITPIICYSLDISKDKNCTWKGICSLFYSQSCSSAF